MSLTGNSTINNFISSVTGSTDKAYILLRKSVVALNEASTTGNYVAGLSGIASSLSNSASLVTQNSGTMISGLMDATTDNIASVESYDKYTAVQVQYNPHSIKFQGSQGVQRRAGVGAQDEYVQTQMPTETHMMVQLEFDDTNITDAFMFDRLNILTSGGAVQTIEKAVSSALGKEYSVQNISEVFVAAMVRPVTRYVAFIWNKMVFWGELNHVSVRYTMFNTSGSPIRSQVSLRIRQDRAEGDATNAYATEKDWEKAFTTMFSKTTKSNAFGVTNKVSNLIGL